MSEQRIKELEAEVERLNGENFDLEVHINALAEYDGKLRARIASLEASLNKLLTEALAIHGDDLADSRTIEQARAVLQRGPAKTNPCYCETTPNGGQIICGYCSPAPSHSDKGKG